MARSSNVAYAMSDLAPGELIGAGTVSVPADKGGCGREHHVKTNPERRPYIDCEACGAYLVGHHVGWANTPHGVPLTPDELGEVEVSKRDGETSYRLAMKAMGDAVGQIVQGNKQGIQTRATAPSLAEQLAALSPAEKAELRAILGDPQPAADGAADPAPLTGDAGPKPAPARRPPGRPRKDPA